LSPLALEQAGREVVEMQDADSVTFRQDDGRYATYLFPAPVNFRDEAGRWRPIDNALVVSRRAGYSFENRANAYSAAFPSSLAAGPVRFEAEGAWVTFALRGARSSAEGVRADGARATFELALAGVSVEYEARTSGLKETFVLAGPSAPREFVFDLRLSPGLSARADDEGGIAFLNPAGTVVFALAAPFMEDSSGSEDGFSSAVELELEEEKAGWVLRLRADGDWLGDPARVWPVRIDPTIVTGPGLDCLIRSGGFSTTNYCSAGHVTVGSSTTKRRSLLAFGLGSVPSNRAILDAELFMYCTYAETGAAQTMDVHRVTASWGNAATWEKKTASVNWASAGGDYGSLAWASLYTRCQTLGWKKWQDPDLVGLVERWKDGTYPNWGLLIKQRSEQTTQVQQFASTESSDSSKWPYLRVEYMPAELPALELESPMDEATVPVSTPVLRATTGLPDPMLDAEGTPLEYEFELASDDTFNEESIRCFSDWIPTTNTWTVPAECSLADGATYWWRARVANAFEEGEWTDPRAFEVRLPKLGTSELWPLWSHDLLAVNQANGNLVLSLPGPGYPSAVASLGASVTYNSLDERDRGLGAGWTLDAGDELGSPPSALIDHALMDHHDGYDAVEIVFPGAESAYYAHVGASNTYISEPGDGSLLTRNEDGSWTLVDVDGSLYTFGPADPDTFTATLTGAELVSAAPAEWALTYEFAGALDPQLPESDRTKITKITDPAGRELVFDWHSLDANACPDALLCLTGPDGVTWRYVGDASGGTSGRLTSVHNGTRDLYAVTYESGQSDRIVKIENANDLDAANASPGYDDEHALEIGYDQEGRVTEVAEGPVSGQTPSVSIWTFTYHPGEAQTPRTARGAAGYTTLTPPREQGKQNPAQQRSYYDRRGRLIESVDLLGEITASEYNDRDQTVWAEDEDANRTEYEWDEHNGVLLVETGPDPDGPGGLDRPVTRYRYDETKIGTTEQAGPPLQGLQASYYTNLNLAGRPHARRTDAQIDQTSGGGWPNLPGGQTSNFSVRWTANLQVETAGDYTFSTNASDGVRLTVAGVHALEEAVRTGPATVTASQPIPLAAGEHRIVLEYFARTTTPAQVQLRWSGPGTAEQAIPAAALRPAWLNQTSTVSPSGRVSFSHFAHPASGQPDYELQELAGGTNVITSYTYDGAGRVTQKVLPKGNAGRTIDANGNLTGTPNTDYATTWEYYGLTETAAPPGVCGGGQAVAQAGLLKSLAHHGIAATTNVYDLAGRAVAVTSGAGVQCDTYDAEGRLSASSAPAEYDGTARETTTYTYDPAGAQLSATDGTLTTASVFDESGRAKRETDSHGAQLVYTYDAEGNVLERAATPITSGPTYTTQYGYDRAGRLVTLTDPAGREYAFTYDARGQLHTVQYPNATFTWMEYNRAGWLTGLYHRHGTLSEPLPDELPPDSQFSPIADYTYAYDIDGRKTQETRTGGGLASETTRYTEYDPLGRLAEVILPDGTCRRYLFDLNSNRTEIKEGTSCQNLSTVETYSYSTGALDQLAQVIKTGQPATAYTYGPGGEVATRGSDELAWDGRGRHTGGTFGSTTVTYGFDPDGFRRERTSGSETTRYLSGGLFETDENGTLTLADVDGPEGDLAHYAGPPDPLTPVNFLYYNGHGDLAAEADPEGDRTGAYTYDPFGQLRSGSTPANATAERFTGRWDKKYDAASELIEMGARPYQPSIGRFLAVDPIEGGAFNPYDYALQDSCNAYDLDGQAVFVPIAVIAIRVTVAGARAYAASRARKEAAKRATRMMLKKTRAAGRRAVAASARAGLRLTPYLRECLAEGSRRLAQMGEAPNWVFSAATFAWGCASGLGINGTKFVKRVMLGVRARMNR
jgi:RHS repeat-associated protein